MKLNYSPDIARKDLLAGVTVAAISLPQAMAYALIAGVDPRFGLYSAIIITLVASIFGSSSHLINGPTNAISLVVFSALAFFSADAHLQAYQAMFLLGIMIGCIQILIAVFKLGDLTRYISESVVIGFMAGAGTLVAVTQIGNLTGMQDRGTGLQHVLFRTWMTVRDGHLNPRAFSLGISTIVLAVALRYLVRKYGLPQFDMLVTLLIVAGAAAWFGWSRPGIDGKTIITTVAGIPRNLPAPHLPRIQFWWIKQMSGSALAIAFLGLLEALAIAKSIANTTRQKLDYNRQCMAEGLANLTGGFFQCLPGSGSLTRSAINFQAGAVSRMSGIFAAGTVALVVVALAPYARYIPKAVLAGLLVITAARLVDWKRLKYAVRASRYDALLVAVTAFSAIFISVEFSILIGVALSILLFVPRADLLRFSELTVSSDRVVRERLPHDPVCTSLLLYDLEGELFFGAAPMLDELFDKLKSRAEQEKIRFIILRVKRARSPDVVCMERFEHFLRDMERNGVTVLLCGVRLGFAGGMERLRFQDWLPADRVFHEEQQVFSATLKAVHRVYELIGENTCEHCRRNEATGSELRELYYLV
ncbi:MAG: SulP family inorganic anion transporter [Candidatus Acidiferrales bacterium]|jgi:SulP family sulfate permease